MDAPFPQPASPKAIAAVNPPPDPLTSCQIGIQKSIATRTSDVKKKKRLPSDPTSSASSSNCCSYSQKRVKISGNPRKIRVGPWTKGRKIIGQSEVDALGLPLGMSIAAVVSQVLDRKNAAGEKMFVDYLSEICILAVRESLENVFGDKFDNFVLNFERSFRSTLMTLRLINESSQTVGKKPQRSELQNKPKASACFLGPTDDTESHIHRNGTDQCQKPDNQENSFVEVTSSPLNNLDSLPHRITTKQVDENISTNLTNRQLVLRGKGIDRQFSCSSTSGINQSSMLTTIEKSVIEQSRSNDLKAFEISLLMKKLQLKEKQIDLNSQSNFLERWKLSLGFSKMSFKAEKFQTQLQDSRQVELLRQCLDFLVSGLIIMLFSIAYGTYVYSHRRIIEATEACSPHKESKSWWMPKSMSTFNSGFHLVLCQVQVFSRMLFGCLVIAAIAYLLIQRSSSSHQTMPITFVLLLLGVICGYAGKFCIDTLGGNGYHWVMYWEALCLLHFFASTFSSTLFLVLNGPILVADRGESDNAKVVPYWMRRLLFFSAMIIIPLLCGLMPFAGPWEWFDHFRSKVEDFVPFVDD